MLIVSVRLIPLAKLTLRNSIGSKRLFQKEMGFSANRTNPVYITRQRAKKVETAVNVVPPRK